MPQYDRNPLDEKLQEDVDQCEYFVGDYLESISANAEK